MKNHFVQHCFVLACMCSFAITRALSQDVTITVNAAEGKRAISPFNP